MKSTSLTLIFTITFTLMLITSFIATAQTQPDTITINKRRPFFVHQGVIYNNASKLGPVLLQDPVDLQVKINWDEYKKFHGIGLGAEIVGVGLMGYSLIQTAKGEGTGTSLIAGAGLLLTGIIIDGFIAAPRFRAAVKNYNDRKMGRKSRN